MANGTVGTSNSLQGFVRLGPGIRFYDPGSESIDRRVHTQEPGLLIFCSWLFAAEKHIAKYIDGYKALFPSTKILLFENHYTNIVYRLDRYQMRSLWPAVAAVKDYLKNCDAASTKPRVLVHVLSNGGTHGVIQLSQAYQESTGDLLPVSALIMDSCPSLPSIYFAYKAMQHMLPNTPLLRLPGLVWIYCTVTFLTMLSYLGFSQPALMKSWRGLNDPSGPFLGKDIARVYIFSKQDALVPAENVLEHAALARDATGLDSQASADLVTCEEFDGSQHVNHLSLDPERYWRIVREASQNTK